MALKNSGQRRALDGIIAGTLYIGLLNGTTEVSGNAYTRQAASTWTASTADTSPDTNVDYTLSTAITFAAPTAAWGTINRIAFYDAATGGNAVFDSPVTQFTPVVGKAVQFPANIITISNR